MSAPDPIATARTARPLFDVENEIKAVADRLTALDAWLSAISTESLNPVEVRAVGRLVGEASGDAQRIERAWTAEFGGTAHG